MSREKQIEEMREKIRTEISKAVEGGLVTWTEFADWLAEALYNADYRKQSEGEWYVNHMTNLFPSKRGRTIHYKTYTCSVCGKSNGRHTSNFCPNCGAKMFVRMTHTCPHNIPNLIPTIEEMKGGAE